MKGFAFVDVLSIFAFLVLIAPSTARPSSIWDVHIDNEPAPPPDKGPPISAHALRDKSKLKYEIIGIVGAYVVWLSITFVLLLLVGKRFRRRIQTSNRTLSMEIVRSAPLMNQSNMSIEPPLKSPGKMASLRSWATSKSHAHKPSNLSVTSTIDEKILAADRARNMDDMARLYAAVAVHDEQRSQKARTSGQTSPRSPNYPPQYSVPPTPRSIALPPTPRSPFYRPDARGAASPRSPAYPPEFEHLRQQHEAEVREQEPPASPRLFHPLAPTPVEDPSSRAVSQQSSRKKVSPLSFSSSERKRPSNISVRGQPISQPLESAPLTQTTIYTNDEPSPRYYNPGPPPPTPGQKAVTADYEAQETVSRKGPPAALSLRSNAPTATSSSASDSTNSLPFRQFYNGEAMKSAPPTKTTFVGIRDSIIGVHPKTGVPQTPYSPYMPFTPITPITPRSLVTKKEMKKNRKAEGLKVLSEDDMVPSDQELWSE